MSLELSSPAFSDGDPISEKYGYTEQNINPPLEIFGIPEQTETLVLIVDDPDAVEPAGKIWDHWLIWNIDPVQNKIPEEWTASEAIEGMNDYGETGYGGPNPPDRQHTYHFRLYALNSSLTVSPGSDRETVESAMEGHVLAQTELTGTYSP